MKNNEAPPPQSSGIHTYARALMRDWPEFASTIHRQGHSLLDAAAPSLLQADLNLVFSEQDYTEATTGPLRAFFRNALDAYTLIAKYRLSFQLLNDPLFKGTHTTLLVPETLLKKHSLPAIEKIQTDLEQKTKLHYQEWQTAILQWGKDLLWELMATGAQLSEAEENELTDGELLSKLKGRYIDQKINPPTMPAQTPPITHYFLLKIHWIFYSMLHRQHQIVDEEKITDLAAPLLDKMDEIARAETTLLLKQKTEIQGLTKTMEPPNGMAF